MFGVDMGDDKPSTLRDVRKGLGLLFRAAKSTVERMPKGKGGVEEAVKTSVREVGRAFGNVASTIERGIFGAKNRHDASPGADDDGDGPNADTDASRTPPVDPKPPRGA
jgi:hypothetical protein